MTFIQRLRALGSDVRGLSTVEYTILLVLVVAGTVGLWDGFGKELVKKLAGATAGFETVGNKVGD